MFSVVSVFQLYILFYVPVDTLSENESWNVQVCVHVPFAGNSNLAQ